MPKFTLEVTQRVPYFSHRVYDAPNLAAAFQMAIDDEGIDDAIPDWETAGPNYVTGAWRGKVEPYKTNSCRIPLAFDDQTRSKADRFETLYDAVEALLAAPYRELSKEQKKGIRAVIKEGAALLNRTAPKIR